MNLAIRHIERLYRSRMSVLKDGEYVSCNLQLAAVAIVDDVQAIETNMLKHSRINCTGTLLK